MRSFLPLLRALRIAVVVASFAATTAAAHLMVEQHGTLNFVGSGAFLVISLPVTAFHGIDDNGDQRVSAQELRDHWAAIEEQVRASVKLSDAAGPRPLEGIILNTSPPHETPDEPAPQIVVLGRFALADEKAPLTLDIGMWGTAEKERSYEIGVTRNGVRRTMVAAPERSRLDV